MVLALTHQAGRWQVGLESLGRTFPELSTGQDVRGQSLLSFYRKGSDSPGRRVAWVRPPPHALLHALRGFFLCSPEAVYLPPFLWI